MIPRLPAFLPLFLMPFACVQAGEKWYTLDEKETLVKELLLKPEVEEEIIIPSTTPLTVGFRANTTHEDFEKYKLANPIKLESLDDKFLWVASVHGAGNQFSPKEGKIRILVTNKSDKPFEIIIYKAPPKY